MYEEKIPCKLSLRTTKTHWKELSDQRGTTLKYFPDLVMNDIVLDFLEDIGSAEGLVMRNIITREQYKKFKKDIEDKKIIISKKNLKLMQL